MPKEKGKRMKDEQGMKVLEAALNLEENHG
jgi:hypothetical protein